MYSLNLRDHFMIAHSLRGAVFGPAQRLHGATYVVDLELRRPALDPDGIVADIGAAGQMLRELLAELNLRNLDDDPALASRNTTTEFLAHLIFQRAAQRIAQGALGPHASGLSSMRVTLHESHVAWAAYEGALPPSLAA